MLETVGTTVLIIVGVFFLISLLLGIVGILVVSKAVKFVNEAEAEDRAAQSKQE